MSSEIWTIILTSIRIKFRRKFSSGSHPINFNFYSKSIKLPYCQITLIILLEHTKRYYNSKKRNITYTCNEFRRKLEQWFSSYKPQFLVRIHKASILPNYFNHSTRKVLFKWTKRSWLDLGSPTLVFFREEAWT